MLNMRWSFFSSTVYAQHLSFKTLQVIFIIHNAMRIKFRKEKFILWQVVVIAIVRQFSITHFPRVALNSCKKQPISVRERISNWHLTFPSNDLVFLDKVKDKERFSILVLSSVSRGDRSSYRIQFNSPQIACRPVYMATLPPLKNSIF